MKNPILPMLLILFSVSCKAQSPILTRYNNPNYAEVENAYYKDLDNIHDQYVGTWLYTNGNTSLKIKFRKRNMVYVNNSSKSFYKDILVGEYQYIENGIEKVNTLENLTEEYSDNTDYNLRSFTQQHKNSYPKCNECAEGEKRLVLTINEPSRRHIGGLSNDFVIRRYFENGVEKLKIWFPKDGHDIPIDQNTGELSDINGYSLPYGEYVLTKQ